MVEVLIIIIIIVDDTRAIYMLGGHQIILKCLSSDNASLITNALKTSSYSLYNLNHYKDFDFNGYVHKIITILRKNITNYQMIYWGSTLLWTFIEKSILYILLKVV